MRSPLFAFLSQKEEYLHENTVRKTSVQYRCDYYLIPVDLPRESLEENIDSVRYTVEEHHLSVFEEYHETPIHLTLSFQSALEGQKKVTAHFYYQVDSKKSSFKPHSSYIRFENDKPQVKWEPSQNLSLYVDCVINNMASQMIKHHASFMAQKRQEFLDLCALYHEQNFATQPEIRVSLQDICQRAQELIVLSFSSFQRQFYQQSLSFYQAAQKLLCQKELESSPQQAAKKLPSQIVDKPSKISTELRLAPTRIFSPRPKMIERWGVRFSQLTKELEEAQSAIDPNNIILEKYLEALECQIKFQNHLADFLIEPLEDITLIESDATKAIALQQQWAIHYQKLFVRLFHTPGVHPVLKDDRFWAAFIGYLDVYKAQILKDIIESADVEKMKVVLCRKLINPYETIRFDNGSQSSITLYAFNFYSLQRKEKTALSAQLLLLLKLLFEQDVGQVAFDDHGQGFPLIFLLDEYSKVEQHIAPAIGLLLQNTFSLRNCVRALQRADKNPLLKKEEDLYLRFLHYKKVIESSYLQRNGQALSPEATRFCKELIDTRSDYFMTPAYQNALEMSQTLAEIIPKNFDSKDVADQNIRMASFQQSFYGSIMFEKFRKVNTLEEMQRYSARQMASIQGKNVTQQKDHAHKMKSFLNKAERLPARFDELQQLLLQQFPHCNTEYVVGTLLPGIFSQSAKAIAGAIEIYFHQEYSFDKKSAMKKSLLSIQLINAMGAKIDPGVCEGVFVRQLINRTSQVIQTLSVDMGKDYDNFVDGILNQDNQPRRYQGLK